jgi:type I restriction enzyme M protein
LEKLAVERDKAEAEVNEHANREIAHIREASIDLLRICSNPKEAARYFTVVSKDELVPNEYNLNMSRYVDTYDEAEAFVPLSDAIEALRASEKRRADAMRAVYSALKEFRS